MWLRRDMDLNLRYAYDAMVDKILFVRLDIRGCLSLFSSQSEPEGKL